MKKPTHDIHYRFDKIVTFYTYGAVAGLVLYMIISLYSGFVGIISEIPTIIQSGGLSHESIAIQKVVLHTIAFTIILIKAYSVLMSYAKTKHLNLKFLLEIGIIAPIIELIFNLSGYKPTMAIFMGCFAIALTVIYLAFYDTLKQVDTDHDEKHS